MDDRRGWAEGLVMLGGTTLLVTFFTPLFREMGNPSDESISAAGLVTGRLLEMTHADGASDLFLGLVAVGFVSAPHVFGLLVGWESAAAALGDGEPKRFFRVVLRCVLSLWLVGSFLLPMLMRDPVDQTFRTMCMVFAGLLIVVWLVVGRWWPPESHTGLMRRGRLLGAILVIIWCGCLLSANDDSFESTMIASMAGAALISIGSVPGLFARAESA